MWKTLLILLALQSASCASAPLPAWHGKIYQGDHKAVLGMDGVTHGGLVRRQANEVIQAEDPAFDDMMGMHWADFRSFAETFVFSCKDWNESAPFTLDQIKSFLQSLKRP